MSTDNIDQLIAELERTLPPVFARAKINRYLGGLFSPGYLATLDSEGKGPEGAIRCGRHIAYTKKAFLIWFRNRLTATERRCGIRLPSKQESTPALLRSLNNFSGDSISSAKRSPDKAELKEGSHE